MHTEITSLLPIREFGSKTKGELRYFRNFTELCAVAQRSQKKNMADASQVQKLYSTPVERSVFKDQISPNGKNMIARIPRIPKAISLLSLILQSYLKK